MFDIEHSNGEGPCKHFFPHSSGRPDHVAPTTSTLAGDGSLLFFLLVSATAWRSDGGFPPAPFDGSRPAVASVANPGLPRPRCPRTSQAPPSVPTWMRHRPP